VQITVKRSLQRLVPNATLLKLEASTSKGPTSMESLEDKQAKLLVLPTLRPTSTRASPGTTRPWTFIWPTQRSTSPVPRWSTPDSRRRRIEKTWLLTWIPLANRDRDIYLILFCLLTSTLGTWRPIVFNVLRFTFLNSLFKVHFSKSLFKNSLFKIHLFEICCLLKFIFWNLLFIEIYFLKFVVYLNSLYEIHFSKFPFWNSLYNSHF